MEEEVRDRDSRNGDGEGGGRDEEEGTWMRKTTETE